MALQNVSVLAFNRGLVSRLGLARVDLKRLELSAEVSRNWLPRVLGSMSIRPGTKYLQSTRSNLANFDIPFVFSVSDKAILELTNLSLRVLVNDVVVSRPAVTSAITNPTFNTDLTGWTDADEAGADSSQVSGAMELASGNNGTTFARRHQTVTVAGANIGVEHALRIEVTRGPVVVKVGTALGDDSYVRETALSTGSHSLAFTPTGNFTVEFRSSNKFPVRVDSCTIEGAGDMVLATPWPTAALPLVRHEQSIDVVFVACTGYQQRRIERRAARSWSVVLYQTIDGPFQAENSSTTTFALDAVATNHISVVTASKATFRSTDVGSLVRISSEGQIVNGIFTQANSFTNSIQVTGTGASRIFVLDLASLTATGTTVTLQKSFTSEDGPWEDHASYTTNQTALNVDDTLSNQIVWYRLGVKTGGYSSGTITGSLTYKLGSIDGIGRILAYSSSTSVQVAALTQFGGTSPVKFWAMGQWSDTRGYPSAGTFFDGRLCWAGKDKFDGSGSDAYDDYGDDEGDAAPIARTIGGQSTDTINWLLQLQQLLLGGEAAEYAARSSSLDEPITPTNFNIKMASSQGSAAVAALKVDQTGIYVQRGGHRVYELSYGENGNGGYDSTHLSALVPEIGAPGIVKMVVQRQPDTRVHCIRSDGTVAVLVFDKVEKVVCWVELDSTGAGGLIEDAVVLPGNSATQEDQVYYTVKRTVNAATVRYRERFSLQSECLGSTLCRLADSSVVYSGSPTMTLLDVAPHLRGQEVVVWGDGKDLNFDDEDGVQQTYTVGTSGTVTLTEAVSNAVVGLPYNARWKSAKLSRAVDSGSGLTQRKQLPYLGLVLADTHSKGLRYGPSFDTMDPMPEVVRGAIIPANTMFAEYDDSIQFPGEWDTDCRICLEARAPRPCTVLAAIAEVEQHATR